MGLRIISGELKGKKLYTPRGDTIRPTGNRQREAIFNILSHRVRHANVLDLFAGTGALGIEALSRGATSAVFVDIDKSIVSVLEKNVKSCRLEDKSTVLHWDVRRRLDPLNTIATSFNLVFMDPPYNQNYVIPAIDNLHLIGCLDTAAVIVVEHAVAEILPDKDKIFVLQDQRRYGKTLVSFFTYMV